MGEITERERGGNMEKERWGMKENECGGNRERDRMKEKGRHV